MIKKTASALLLSCSLLACNLGNATGYVPTPTEIALIQPQIDTTDSIREKFGPPTVVGENETTWYYISSFSEYNTILPAKEVKRRILTINFNADGLVTGVSQMGLNDGQNIPLTNVVTETEGRELSLWEQLRGSIGNFSAESFLNQGQIE